MQPLHYLYYTIFYLIIFYILITVVAKIIRTLEFSPAKNGFKSFNCFL